MPTYKQYSLVGAVLFFVPILLVGVRYYFLHDCNGEFVTPSTILTVVNVMLGYILSGAPLAIPIGLIFLLFGLVFFERSRGVSRTYVFFEATGFILIAFVSLILLASLNYARNKGPNAPVKSVINAFQVVAVSYHSETGSYDQICSSEQATNHFKYLNSEVFDRGLFCAVWSANLECKSNQYNYAVSAKLPHTESGKYYCADSTGFHGAVDTPISEPRCPNGVF